MRMMAGRFRRTLLVLAVAAGMLGAASRGARAEGLAIVGATVVDGAAAPIPDAVVLIDGDRIQAVGSRAQVALPKGITIVDGRGKWVAPGLVDAHVHFFQSGGAYTRPDAVDLRKVRPYEREIALLKAALPRTFARYLLCGVTSVVDVGGPFWNFEVRDAAARTALAPRVAVAGPLISTVDRPQLDIGDPPIIKTATPDEARALVRRELERKPDLMKVWFVFRPGDDLAAGKALVAATVDEARKGGVRTAVHATELETARAAVEAGADVLVHSVFDKPVDDAFVDLLKERHTILCPTLVVFERYGRTFSHQLNLTPEEKTWGNPEVIASLDVTKIPQDKLPDRIKTALAKPDETLDRIKKTYDIALPNLKRLQDAGITIAAGTDAGNIGTIHGPALFREFQLMHEAGLTNMQILQCATANAAKLFGGETGAHIGKIDSGSFADLVILRSDPLRDIKNTSDIDSVMKNGVLYPAQDLLTGTY